MALLQGPFLWFVDAVFILLYLRRLDLSLRYPLWSPKREQLQDKLSTKLIELNASELEGTNFFYHSIDTKEFPNSGKLAQ